MPTLVFKDSCMFLSTSLDQLVNNQYKVGEEGRNLNGTFPHLRRYFDEKWKRGKRIPEEGFKLLLRKGIFPYSWFKTFKCFERNSLPAKEDFYNDLKDSHITEAEYEHAQTCFRTFKCSSFQEFHDLYLETDTVNIKN